MDANSENRPYSGKENSDVYSKAVRAGKRTYFFDVKSTKGKDLYLTITESKKRVSDDGKSFYEKHKIFLYKEDFDKFIDGLNDSTGYIRTNAPASTNPQHGNEIQNPGLTDVEFDDLGNR